MTAIDGPPNRRNSAGQCRDETSNNYLDECTTPIPRKPSRHKKPVTRGGFDYHRVGTTWRERARDAVMIQWHVWRGQCADCGEFYFFPSNKQLPQQPYRRCKKCKRPGAPATPFKKNSGISV